MSIEREGVSSVSLEISKLKMIFREQPTDDYGIDGQIETLENGYATGKLIAVQIKSGESFFKETTENHIVFRGEKKHYNYWINHSLPVIIVLYNPADELCYWQIVNADTATLTEKNWKINIPKNNILRDAQNKLLKIANNQTDFEQKYNSFLLAKPWMNHIVKGDKVLLNVEEWINKTSGRGNFKITIVDESSKEEQVFDRTFWGFGTKSYTQVFKELFPWAEILIDEEEYQEYDEEAEYDNDLSAAYLNYHESIGAKFDRDSFRYIVPKNAPSINEWIENSKNIRPFRIGAGEVAFYQLVLELNDLGRAFLFVDDFIGEGKFYKIKE